MRQVWRSPLLNWPNILRLRSQSSCKFLMLRWGGFVMCVSPLIICIGARTYPLKPTLGQVHTGILDHRWAVRVSCFYF